jgi:hypothetical protein
MGRVKLLQYTYYHESRRLTSAAFFYRKKTFQSILPVHERGECVVNLAVFLMGITSLSVRSVAERRIWRIV